MTMIRMPARRRLALAGGTPLSVQAGQGPGAQQLGVQRGVEHEVKHASALAGVGRRQGPGGELWSGGGW